MLHKIFRLGQHKPGRDFPGRETHITRDMFFPAAGMHITRDMCFPGRGTHITRDMCFQGRGTHITRAVFPRWGNTFH